MSDVQSERSLMLWRACLDVMLPPLAWSVELMQKPMELDLRWRRPSRSARYLTRVGVPHTSGGASHEWGASYVCDGEM